MCARHAKNSTSCTAETLARQGIRSFALREIAWRPGIRDPLDAACQLCPLALGRTCTHATLTTTIADHRRTKGSGSAFRRRSIAGRRGAARACRGRLAVTLVALQASRGRKVVLNFGIGGHAEQAGKRDKGCHEPAVQYVLTHCLSPNAGTIGRQGNHWMSRNVSPARAMLQLPCWENGESRGWAHQPSAGTAFGLPSPSSATMTKSACVTFSIRSER